MNSRKCRLWMWSHKLQWTLAYYGLRYRIARVTGPIQVWIMMLRYRWYWLRMAFRALRCARRLQDPTFKMMQLRDAHRALGYALARVA